MFQALMVTSAFVIGAAALVVALLTMSACASISRRMASVDRWAGDVNHKLAQVIPTITEIVEGRISSTSQATLRAELDDLRGALDVIRASNRKEFGALWGRMGGRSSGQTSILNGETGEPLQGDDELDALLALQRAKPVAPTS